MKNLIRPTSDLSKTTLLNRVLANLGPADPGQEAGPLAPQSLLGHELCGQVRAVTPDFVAIQATANQVTAGWRREADLLNGEMVYLTWLVRDFQEGVRRRRKRLGQPAAVLQFYRMPLRRNGSVTGGRAAWITRAKELVKGDRAAVAAGHPPMEGPSATELAEALEPVETAHNRWDLAFREHKDGVERTRQVRAEAEELIMDLACKLRFELRKKPPAMRREIMRAFGFRFNGDSRLEPERPEPVEVDPVEEPASRESAEAERAGEPPATQGASGANGSTVGPGRVDGHEGMDHGSQQEGQEISGMSGRQLKNASNRAPTTVQTAAADGSTLVQR
jgi:hypothetical protein